MARLFRSVIHALGFRPARKEFMDIYGLFKIWRKPHVASTNLIIHRYLCNGVWSMRNALADRAHRELKAKA